MFMSCNHAFYLVWIAMAVGWVIAFLPIGQAIKVRPHWPRLLGYLTFQFVLMWLAVALIPGWKHPIFIAVIAGTLLISPWFMTRIGAFESVRDGELGRLYTKLLNILFTISLIPLMDLWAQEYKLFTFTLAMHLFLAASLYLTGTPAILHRQQRMIMKRTEWKKAADLYMRE